MQMTNTTLVMLKVAFAHTPPSFYSYSPRISLLIVAVLVGVWVGMIVVGVVESGELRCGAVVLSAAWYALHPVLLQLPVGLLTDPSFSLLLLH